MTDSKSLNRNAPSHGRAPRAAGEIGPETPGAFFCAECGAWLLHGGIVHDEGEHEPRRQR